MTLNFSFKSGYLIFIGLFFLIPCLFFSKLTLFYYISSLFFFIYLLISYEKIKILFLMNKSSFFFLIFYYFFLFLSVFYSPLIESSFNILMRSYLVNLVIFLAISIFFLCDNYKNDYLYYISYLVISFYLCFLIYLLYFVFLKCGLNFLCFFETGFGILDDIYKKNIYIIYYSNLTPSLVLVFFISMFLFFVNTNLIKRTFFLILAVLIFLNILWLRRRAGLLGILISFMSLFFIMKLNFKKIASIIFLFFLILLPFLCIPTLREKVIIRDDKIDLIMKDVERKHLEQYSSMGPRLYEWSRSFKRIAESPFVGTGLGRKIAKLTFYKDSFIGHPHNTFISIAVQSGLQTIICFFIFLFIISYKTFKNLKYILEREKKIDWFLMCSFMYLISYFVMANFAGFEEKAGFIPFWVVTGALVGYNTSLKLLNRPQ